MVLIAIPAGVLIGLFLGALGGGGSILTVPALVYLLGQPAHAATTGSLIIVGVTALTGIAAHFQAGRVRVAQGITFGMLGVVGSWAGTRLSAHVSPDLLLVTFAGLMLAAAAAMFRRSRSMVSVKPRARQRGTAACSLPSPSARFDPCHGIRVVLAATAVGLLTGFFGVGGGFVIVPALVLALGFDMPSAVGTSLLVIAINAATGLLARAGTHADLDWPLLAVFIAAAMAGSLGGNWIASRADAAKLTRSFSVLLVVVALYTAARSLPHVL